MQTPTAQYLAREFMVRYAKNNIAIIAAATKTDPFRCLYAISVKGEGALPKSDCADFWIDEETLKDAVILFLFDSSISGSDVQYNITHDLIESVFAIVKAKLHSYIAIGHIELLFDPDRQERLAANGIIGISKKGFVTTVSGEPAQ